MTVILRTLAGNSAISIKLATVICRLITTAAELGELETFELPDPLNPDGTPLTCKRMPREWLERLAVAVDRGALDSIDVERIVEILLQGRREPAPTRAVA
jgi:hypothetical protein